jgi:hypothetical protein
MPVLMNICMKCCSWPIERYLIAFIMRLLSIHKENYIMSQDILVVAENVQTNGVSGGVAGATVSVATASGTSIPLTGRVVRVSASAATTSASCTLANGTLDGQQVTLVNESANNIVISGGIKGSTACTVSASIGALFTWVAADTAWFPTKC